MKALEMDPTLWCAYERLCHIMPKELDGSKYFKEDHPAVQKMNSFIFNERN